MQSFAVILCFLSTIAVISAFDISGIPDCAILCFASGLGKSPCAADDTICQCSRGKEAFSSNVTPCIQKQCSPIDAAKVGVAAAEICAKAYSSYYSLLPTSTSAASGSVSTALRNTNGTITTGTLVPTVTANAAAGQDRLSFGRSAVVAVVVVAVGGGFAAV